MAHGKSRLSEATVNKALCKILSEKHVRWQDCIESEKADVLLHAVGKSLDIIVYHPGSLPVIIESEFEPARTVEEDAQSRLGCKLSADGCRIEQVIALKIPSIIATVKQQHLEEALSATVFRYALLMINGLKQTRWPEKGYIEGRVDDFVSFVEQTALSESIMTKGMEVLENSISVAANIIQRDSHPAVSTQKNLAALLNQVESEQTTRMAMAILANAVSFHNTISKLHGVLPLSEFTNPQGIYIQSKISIEWKRIYTEINYWPIIYIATEILSSLRPNIASRVFSVLVESTQQLEGIGATSQHDLSGRMLQRLIADRKFLATFYTLPSSATLLAELAISRLNVDWSKPEEITNLQIGDFACGTGALLNAAYSSVLTRYRRTGGNDSKLHAPLIEKSLVGTDIMPAATHLTASILSNAHPAEQFLNTRIITLPYGKNKNAGGETIDLGSLDLIKDEEVFSLFKTGQDVVAGKAGGDTRRVALPHKSFDLVIMNPPFTRPTNHAAGNKDIPNPAFAGFSTGVDEQREMSKKLRGMKACNLAGNGQAGLASSFIDIAEAKIKEGGVLALVIPFTFTAGSSWQGVRTLLEDYYKNIVVVSIASAGSTDMAFSADTGIGEVLVIATRSKLKNTEKPSVLYVNLDHRPASIVEASEISRTILRITKESNRGVVNLGSDLHTGQFIWSRRGFRGYAGIKDSDLAQTALAFYEGCILLPRLKSKINVSVAKIGDLGVQGPGHRSLNGMARLAGMPTGPFDVVKSSPNESSTYPMLWAHDHKKETRFVVDTDTKGLVRVGQEQRALEIWHQHACRLCFNLDFRINSQPLSACLTSKKALGGRAWSGYRCHDVNHEVSILLFANTTLGLISHWWHGSRQQSGRYCISVSKIPEMMTIDPREFTAKQFAKADEIFNCFKTQEFLAANEVNRDDVRIKLDEAVLLDLLGLDSDILESLDLLRHKWCSEPSVHGGKSTRPT